MKYCKKFRRIVYNLKVGKTFPSKIGSPEVRYKIQGPKTKKSKRRLGENKYQCRTFWKQITENPFLYDLNSKDAINTLCKKSRGRMVLQH